MENYLRSKNIATQAVHAAHTPSNYQHRPGVTPIMTCATFHRENRDVSLEDKNYRYGRFGNPTRDALEGCLATLEGAKYGLTFAAGMGAISSVTQLLTTGDHIICCNNVYAGVPYYFEQVALRLGYTYDLVNATNLERIRKAVKPNTKMIWLESATNPTLQILDIAEIHKIATSINALLVVDNTFLTPYFCKPLKYGADIVVYSLAKYMNGHSDVIMGGAVTNNDDLYNRLKAQQIASGNVPGPFDCYQSIRGLKTLALRMRQHSQNALAIAHYLESHPNIIKVLHPGLSSHPQHALAKRQCSGHSGMLSFYLQGGLTEAKKFLKELKLFGVADSLGGVESLMEIPQLMSHYSMTPEQFAEAEITGNFIRCSVGIEDEADLIEDIKQALTAVFEN